MPSKLLLCLMLCCVGLPVAARDAQLMSPNGGSCAVTQEETATDGDAVRGTPDKRAGQPAAAARPASTRRSGDGEAATRAPRWHSFLPGMFR